MGTTVFIHASVAFPRALGQHSYILESVFQKPFLVSIVDACVHSSHVDKTIVLTSDDARDQRVVDGLIAHYGSEEKNLIIHRVAAHEAYSFQYARDQVRPVSFPYQWHSARGCFTVVGLQALVQQYAVTRALLLEADECCTMTCQCIDALCEALTDKAVRYVYKDPYRECIGVAASFFNDTVRKYKNRLEKKCTEKSLRPLLIDLFSFVSEDEHEHFNVKNAATYQENFFPLLRKYEYDFLRFAADSEGGCLDADCEALKKRVVSSGQDYLEIELTNQCDEQCSFCPVAQMHDEAQTLSADAVRKLIDDFSCGGTVLNFSGYGEPLLDENLCQYIAEAKKKGIPSVWLETHGRLIDDARAEVLVASGLDLLIINANVYSDDESALCALIQRLQKAKKNRDLFLPLIAVQFVVSSWLTQKENDFLVRIEKQVDHVIIRSPREYPELGITFNAINFAPVERSFCVKTDSSRIAKANGSFAVCDNDLCGIAGEQHAMCAESVSHAILTEHLAGEYANTLGACRSCREWYVSNLGQTYAQIDYTSLVRLQQQGVASFCRSLETEVLAQCEEKISSLVTECDTLITYLYEKLQLCTVAASAAKDTAVKGILSRQLRRVRALLCMYEAKRQVIHRYYVALGDAYISHKEYEKGLAVWERVLRYDPSHGYIHAQLDRLLHEYERDNHEYSTT